MSKTSKNIASVIKDASKDKTKGYDTTAVVKRVENGTAWVHIPGGVDETPAQMTMAAKPGDAVQVRVSGGRAWLQGNATAPPTDDARANEVFMITQPSVDYVKALEDKDVTVKSITAATGYIDDLYSKNITTDNINAATGYIKDLTSENITAETLSAAAGFVGDLTSESITAQDIIADHETVGTLDATYATIDELHSDYAEIDLANVNNAWIQNGVVKDAAISDAQIIGVSANKLTAGTIDASNITVTNLNASNITTGSITVDGITIDVENNEANIDGAYIEDGTITMNGLAQSVQNAIDGAIETHTGTVVPTLNNAPASSWTTNKLKDSHVGDIYYVINAGHEADGYCYRFAKSGNTYSWVLIQDSDVTAALSRLTTAEGKIEGLETFESETSSWITDTDEELSSVKSNVTSLTGRMTTAEGNISNKVDTSTFNTLSQTVGENTSNITSLSTITTNNGLTSETNITNTVNTVSQTATGNSSKLSQLTMTLGTNADGTTKAGDVMHRTSDLEQDLDGFKTTVSSTYETKSDASALKSRVSTAESTLTQHASDISARVTQTDFEKVQNKLSELIVDADGIRTEVSKKVGNDEVISRINQSAESIQIQASKVAIEADNFVTQFGTDGVKLHPKNDDLNYTTIDPTNGMNVYKGGVSVAEYGDTARVGNGASGHVTVKSDGLHIWKNAETTPTNEVGKFTAAEIVLTNTSGDYITDTTIFSSSNLAYLTTAARSNYPLGGFIIKNTAGNEDIDTILALSPTYSDVSSIASSTEMMLSVSASNGLKLVSAGTEKFSVSNTGSVSVGGYKLITTGSVSKAGSAISGGGHGKVTVAATKTGYTPIGIIGYTITGTNTQNIVPYQMYLNGTTATAKLRNVGSSSYTPTVTFYVLYIASGQGI